MEQKFEGFIDNMLDRIFSNLGAQLLVFNRVLSVFFLIHLANANKVYYNLNNVKIIGSYTNVK